MLKKITVITLLLTCLNPLMAQRNNIKVLGYVYTNNFKNAITTSSEIEFFAPNHAYGIGYERTIGNRVSVGLAVTFPASYTSTDNVTLYDNLGEAYRVGETLKGMGFMYESRYYLNDFDKGAVDGAYLAASVGQFSYTNTFNVTSYSLTPKPEYLGQTTNSITLNKLGFRYGYARASDWFVSDYYIGIDLNYWNNSFDRSTFKQLENTSFQHSYAFVFGWLLGFNL